MHKYVAIASWVGMLSFACAFLDVSAELKTVKAHMEVFDQKITKCEEKLPRDKYCHLEAVAPYETE